VQIVQIVQILN